MKDPIFQNYKDESVGVVVESSFFPLLQLMLASCGMAMSIRIAVYETKLDEKPFSCSFCMGFWCFLFLYFLRKYSDVFYYPISIGFITALISYYIDRNIFEGEF